MAVTTTEDPKSALVRLQSDVRKFTPGVDFEYVDVKFPSSTNVDVVVQTRLRSDNPDNIIYTVVGLDFFTAPTTTPCIYKDVSATRHVWQNGFIVLRSNVASFTAHLRLELKRANNVT